MAKKKKRVSARTASKESLWQVLEAGQGKPDKTSAGPLIKRLDTGLGLQATVVPNVDAKAHLVKGRGRTVEGIPGGKWPASGRH